MKSNKKIFPTVLIIISLNFLSILAQAQNCKDVYNYALGLYQKGQFENINNSLANCINDINRYGNEYMGNRNGKNRSTAFKVYKLIITSYRNLDQENLADQKLDQLASISNIPKDQVLIELNNTPLTIIE